LVESGKAGGRLRAIALHQGFERRIEVGAQVEPASDMAKLDNLDTHRKRCHKLRALQWLGRVR
jgi:hypothetical protein